MLPPVILIIKMKNSSEKIVSVQNGPKKLGTFGGVFTPSILTILGIILFLRLGYVIGSAGLMKALLIIAIANAISVLTSISLSAVATNLKVKGGGDYYLISRTLGVEFGGALGLVLFLAQSVSVAFYCIGFGEAMSAFSSHPAVTPQTVALAAVALLFILAWMGADWATRFQYVVMAFLCLALLSFFVGGMAKWDIAVATSNWRADDSSMAFWVLFAIFFPAVTGFTQGVSMSGDLADPERSLPLGTFMAVGISIVIYFSAAVIMAGAMPLGALRQDYGAMKQTAAWGVLIDAGVIAATLSSAMASFLGAPRILQSLAADRVFSQLTFFAKGYGTSNNPRRAVVLSALIAVLTISIGSLNLIASTVSMFFLISYGLLNYATYFEAKAGSPSFRPRFHFFHYRLSLVGALACLGVMLAIDPLTGVVAASVIFAIYQYLKRTAGPARWADGRRSWHLQEIRAHLQGLAEDPEHPRDWRPHILALSNEPMRRGQLLQMSDWIAGHSGFTTVVRMIEGAGGQLLHSQKEAEQELRADVLKHGSNAFPKVVFSPDPESVLSTLVQAYGIGPLKPNTVMLNWYSPETERDTQRMERMIRMLRGVYRLGCNVIMCNVNSEIQGASEVQQQRRIDIWWQEDATGRLSLLLGYLMKKDDAWSSARITVFTAEERFRTENGREILAKEIEDARIEANLEILEQPDQKQVIALSAQSDMVLLPFRFKSDQIITLFDRPAFELLRWFTSTVMVQAAEDIDLGAEPESGEAAERAEALDSMNEAKEKAAKALKEAEAARNRAEKALQKLEALKSSPADADDDLRQKAKKEAEMTRMEAEKFERKAAKAKAKADIAENEAAQSDPTATKTDQDDT